MGNYQGDLFLDVARLRLNDMRATAERERLAHQASEAQRREPWYSFLLSRPIEQPEHPDEGQRATPALSLGYR